MARNKHEGFCYVCGLNVRAGTGHFERHAGGWRVKHAHVSGGGRVTCQMAQAVKRRIGELYANGGADGQ